MAAILRYSDDGTIVMVEDEDGFHAPSQDEMDTLEVGEDLTKEELEALED